MTYILMIPGPVEISDDVLEAYNGQPVAHYGEEWTGLYLDTIRRTSRLFGCSGRTFLIPGSGSVGLETMATTLCTGRKCLVLRNGMFGDRLGSIVATHAAAMEVLDFPLDRPADPAEVKKACASGGFDVVLTVQVETSTGLLNPVRELAEAAKRSGSLFAVDAISSAAIETMDMDGWGIDALVTASQKGLETPPGLGIVTVAEHLIDHIEHKEPRAWYTDLRVWCDYYNDWHDWHPFPVTLPTNNVRALARSLDVIEAAGMEARHGAFCETTAGIRRALSALGLRPFVGEDCCAHGLTGVSTERRFDPARLIAFLKQQMGIQVAGSFSELKDRLFRMGHMGRKQCRPENMAALIGGIGLFMRRENLKPDVGRALEELAAC